MDTFKLGRKSLELIIAAAVILALWQLISMSVSNQMLPSPWLSLKEFIRLFPGTLMHHFLVSSYRVVVSLALALMTAVPLGLILGREEKIDRYFAPVVYLSYPIPKIVFLPVILLLFGIGDLSKVFLIGLIVFFQILVTTRDAAKGIPQPSIASMLSLGAGRKEIYRHVIFPACLPKIITSLRISLGTAIAVLFFAESFATTEGLGYFIMDAWSRAAYSEMFAGIIGMSLLGFILYMALDYVENRACRWQYL